MDVISCWKLWCLLTSHWHWWFVSCTSIQKVLFRVQTWLLRRSLMSTVPVVSLRWRLRLCKHSSQHYTTAFNTRQVESMESYLWCQVCTLPSTCESTNKDSSKQMTFFFHCSQSPAFCSWLMEHYCLFSLVVHPPKDSKWCAFCNAFLLTMFLRSGYLCYYSLPIRSNHSPLNKSPSCESQSLLHVKITGDQQFMKCHGQSHWDLIICPILTFLCEC